MQKIPQIISLLLIYYICWCYSCEICGKRFSQKTVLQSHATVHSEERPHPCTVCGKSFKQFSSLYIHSKLHLPDQAKFKFPCSYCPKKWVHYLIVQSISTEFYFTQTQLKSIGLFNIWDSGICPTPKSTDKDIVWQIYTGHQSFPSEIWIKRYCLKNCLKVHSG